MAKFFLGLDLGPTSIGWALINELGGFVSIGTRIFPEGVDRDQQGGEQSKSQVRRESRGMRRQIRRRARRKRIVREALQRVGLLPATIGEVRQLLAEGNGALPYRLRANALTSRLTEHQLGRVFFQLATRRGFLSNRKTDKASDNKGMLLEIGELQEALTKNGEQLGQYLCNLDERFDHRTSHDEDRVRHRHTRRSM
jgi:CRISPR-associated endonuclease Csn1